MLYRYLVFCICLTLNIFLSLFLAIAGAEMFSVPFIFYYIYSNMSFNSFYCYFQSILQHQPGLQIRASWSNIMCCCLIFYLIALRHLLFLLNYLVAISYRYVSDVAKSYAELFCHFYFYILRSSEMTLIRAFIYLLYSPVTADFIVFSLFLFFSCSAQAMPTSLFICS